MAIHGGRIAVGLLAAVASVSAALAAPEPPPAAQPGDAVIKVDGHAITRGEYDIALARGARQSYYHGNVTEERLGELRAKVVEDLILDRLLAAETDRRALKGDPAEVEARIAGYEEQYKNSAEWKAQREQTVPKLRERMLQNSRRSQLETAVRQVAAPGEAELGKYYKDNIASFTEPSRDHLQVILLKVDPSSPQQVWDQARGEAAKLRGKILAGDSFEDLAKLHSGDDSAEKGGDLGYLHRGMLADEAQAAVDKMKPGDLSEPVLLLQGYALFKLLDRSPERVRPLDEVRERAGELYRRNKGDQRWSEFTQSLRKQAKVWVDASLTGPRKSSGAQ